MKKILIIDNYDSFTYNLVQIVDENFKGTFEVKRNDEIELEEIEQYELGLLLVATRNICIIPVPKISYHV